MKFQWKNLFLRWVHVYTYTDLRGNVSYPVKRLTPIEGFVYDFIHSSFEVAAYNWKRIMYE